jgi:hypothetical protein
VLSLALVGVIGLASSRSFCWCVLHVEDPVRKPSTRSGRIMHHDGERLGALGTLVGTLSPFTGQL